MSLRVIATRARRVLTKPPTYVLRRVWSEIDHTLARFTQPAFGRNFSTRDLLRRTAARDAQALWARLLDNSRRLFPELPARQELDSLVPGESARILEAAARALRNEIDLLGSGTVKLGAAINWHRDYKTGDGWPIEYFRKIDYLNVERASDVKTVWELSRMQWLMPCAQAWVLTRDEKYAQHVREVLDDWIAANPYACGVNWGVTMEPAMRLLTWTWMLRACADSAAFADTAFRERLMSALFLHGVFTEKYIERSDVNGNHFTADAAALVVVGALFGAGADAERWLREGQHDLEHEIVRQVHADGVDFEASSAYHRLVAELFLFASVALRAAGRATSEAYRQRLAGMARFTAAYSRPDGFAPLWGDNDNARALPFGTQPLRDHRYLVGLIALYLGNPELLTLAGGARGEAAWLFGPSAANALSADEAAQPPQAFRDGGVYVLRDARNHVFIDCGPIGLAGRGGHGHNDLLSFEAVLDGVPLITEGGCYVYTADTASRDIDRGTRSHNTPLVDGQEINRFLGPEFRWNMHNDAAHELVEFAAGSEVDLFIGRHTGFARLASPLTVQRTLELVHASSSLRLRDRFIGAGENEVLEPLHLNPAASARQAGDKRLVVEIQGRSFEIAWTNPRWTLEPASGREAASYGAKLPTVRLEWRARGADLEFEILIQPLPGGAPA
jgi:hypothetical protein